MPRNNFQGFGHDPGTGVGTMHEEDFSGNAAGRPDAIAYVQRDATRRRVVEGIDVRAIRAAAGMTQAAFAAAYQIPVGTIRDWEQGRRMPDAPARTLLKLIAADPAAVERVLGAA
ncbi:helix-turn-helix domain-containing protein [Novosphingobium terrae]|uniref:helix-turn-helix domain-containing protein n=1 Tax=Novosphingobium terrae TaxID=2726189 RepID=UPI001F12B3A1|nr:helix-turn-helix domain-containing protein [Novosphingobium terrae]